MKLGPENEDGKYAYSIITTPYKALLWVLVRDTKTFKKQYDAEVLDYLKKNGFNFIWNKPRETYQGQDCLYP